MRSRSGSATAPSTTEHGHRHRRCFDARVGRVLLCCERVAGPKEQPHPDGEKIPTEQVTIPPDRPNRPGPAAPVRGRGGGIDGDDHVLPVGLVIVSGLDAAEARKVASWNLKGSYANRSC